MKKQYKCRPKLRNTSPKSENCGIYSPPFCSKFMTLSFCETSKYIKNLYAAIPYNSSAITNSKNG